MARLSWDEFDATLTRVMRECLADGVFPSVRQVQARGITCDNSKVGRAIRAKIESGEVEIPRSLPGLKAARAQWLRAGKRPARFREPRGPSEYQLQQATEADERIPVEVIRERAAEIKAENFATGKGERPRRRLRWGSLGPAEAVATRAIADYRGAWRRISGSTGREDRPGQEPRC